MLKGNQKKIDVAKPFGKINEKDFAKLRANKNVGGMAKDKKGKVHSTLEGQKASLKRFMKLGEKQGRFYPKKKEKKKKLEQN